MPSVDKPTKMIDNLTVQYDGPENIIGIITEADYDPLKGSQTFPTMLPVLVQDAKSLYQAVAFIFIFLVIVFINLRVICIVADFPFRRLRPINLLVAHLSVIVIVLSSFHALFYAERMSLLGSTGIIPCKLFAFGRNIFYAAYPLNVVMIVYERAGTFHDTVGDILVMRTIGLLWTIAGLESVLSPFTVEYKENSVTHFAQCEQIPLFGSFWATTAYLFIRFLLRHVVIIGYLCYALYSIRSKIKFLYIFTQIPPRFRATVRRLRFVYLYSILYIILWLPTGLVVFADALLARAGKDYSVLQTYFMIMIGMNYVYFILCPFLFLSLNEDVKTNYWYPRSTCCKIKGSGSDLNTNPQPELSGFNENDADENLNTVP